MVLTGLPLSSLVAAAAAMSVLIVALYWLKLRRRPLMVPFAPLWQQLLQQTDARRLWSRLRRWLSLLLHLALALLLVLALGDPRPEAALGERHHWVLLLDASASMQATDVAPTRWDEAIARAKEFVDGMGANDAALIVEMGARPRPLSTMSSERKELLDALERASSTAARADLAAALRFADDALAGLSRPQILLLSDGALTTSAVPSRVDNLSWFPIGKGGNNVALTDFSVRRYPLDHTRYEALLEVSNLSSEPVEVELTLWGDDQVVDISRLSLDANEVLSRFYSDLGGADQHLKATIRALNGSDRLQIDDTAYALLPERHPLNILAVTSGNSYLEAALLLDEYLKVTTVAPGTKLPAGPFDVTILDGVAPALSPDYGGRIYLGSPEDGTPVSRGKVIEDFGFDSWRKNSPYLRWIAMENIQVATGYALKPQKGDTIEGASELGPILISGRRETVPFVQLGFSPRDSDLVLRVGWPLLLLNTINEFSHGDAEYIAGYKTGRAWQIPTQIQSGQAQLHLPDGSTTLAPISEGRAKHFGGLPGFYALKTAQGVPVAEFAANLGDGAESALDVPDHLPFGTTKLSAIPKSPPAGRRPLWMWLLLVAFGLSLLEWQTYHRRVTV